MTQRLVRAAALALLLTTLPWHAATAQTAVPCTAIENDAERLACYDRALRGTPPHRPSIAPAARTAAPTAAPRLPPPQHPPPRRRPQPRPSRAAHAAFASRPRRLRRPRPWRAAGATRRSFRSSSSACARCRAATRRSRPRTARPGCKRTASASWGCPTRRSTPRSNPARWAATSSCRRSGGRAIRVRAGSLTRYSPVQMLLEPTGSSKSR